MNYIYKLPLSELFNLYDVCTERLMDDVTHLVNNERRYKQEDAQRFHDNLERRRLIGDGLIATLEDELENPKTIGGVSLSYKQAVKDIRKDQKKDQAMCAHLERLVGVAPQTRYH